MNDIWKCDEYYFSESVESAFGQNIFVTGVGLTVVFSLTPYAKANGQKLKPSVFHCSRMRYLIEYLKKKEGK